VKTTTTVPDGKPLILMSRIYDAPRQLVWETLTQAKHVARWWGGAGVTNPVCEMDVRPGGVWRQVMRFADGRELHMRFEFVLVEEPAKLVWRSTEHRPEGLPSSTITVSLDDVGGRTHWKMVSEFATLADRDRAIAAGFSHPIEMSSEGWSDYLKSLQEV
jgi:uncharacterized protein YndB with AHSA1/START domain